MCRGRGRGQVGGDRADDDRPGPAGRQQGFDGVEQGAPGPGDAGPGRPRRRLGREVPTDDDDQPFVVDAGEHFQTGPAPEAVDLVDDHFGGVVRSVSDDHRDGGRVAPSQRRRP